LGSHHDEKTIVPFVANKTVAVFEGSNAIPRVTASAIEACCFVKRAT
jgi:hypothetical protein